MKTGLLDTTRNAAQIIELIDGDPQVSSDAAADAAQLVRARAFA